MQGVSVCSMDVWVMNIKNKTNLMFTDKANFDNFHENPVQSKQW